MVTGFTGIYIGNNYYFIYFLMHEIGYKLLSTV